MEVESGHSGGPVFDRRGALIGMVAGYELGDTTKRPYVSPRITYAIPSKRPKGIPQACRHTLKIRSPAFEPLAA